MTVTLPLPAGHRAARGLRLGMCLSYLIYLLKAAPDHQKCEACFSVLVWLVVVLAHHMTSHDITVGSVRGCGRRHVYWSCSFLIQFVRCSVDGLSLPMFVLAVLGNVTYSLGIFLYSVHPNFLMPALPWIVGSVGTLLFDGTVSSLNLCEPRGSHSYWYKVASMAPGVVGAASVPRAS